MAKTKTGSKKKQATKKKTNTTVQKVEGQTQEEGHVVELNGEVGEHKEPVVVEEISEDKVDTAAKIDSLMGETEGVDVSVVEVEETPYQSMIVAFKLFLRENRIVKNFNLRLTEIKPEQHYIYQGSLTNKWATLNATGYHRFYKPSLLNAIRTLDPKKDLLAKYFINAKVG